MIGADPYNASGWMLNVATFEVKNDIELPQRLKERVS